MIAMQAENWQKLRSNTQGWMNDYENPWVKDREIRKLKRRDEQLPAATCDQGLQGFVLPC
jgi:hypothetical protein